MQNTTATLKSNTRADISGQEFSGKDKKLESKEEIPEWMLREDRDLDSLEPEQVKPRKPRATKPNSKPKQQKYNGRTEALLTSWMNGQTVGGKEFPGDFRVWQSELGEAPQIVQVLNGQVSSVGNDHIAAFLANALTDNFGGTDLEIPLTDCLRVVKRWQRSTFGRSTLKSWPRPVCFDNYDGLAFSRLPFHPEACSSEEFPIKCPVLYKMSQRMDNAKAVFQKVAQIYDLAAPRKQVIWFYGPTGGGKSGFITVLSKLYGGKSGTCSITNKLMNSPHWQESLIGKTLVQVLEAKATTLETDDFLSLVGDRNHSINPKGKPMFFGRFDFHMTFASNEAPKHSGKEEIRDRIIACHMDSIPKEERLSETDLEIALNAELKYFLGYCMELYKELPPNGFITSSHSSQGKSEEAIAEFNEAEEAVFDACFQYAEGDNFYQVTSAEFMRLISTYVRDRITSESKMRKYLRSRYNCVIGKEMRVNGKRDRYISNIRPKLAHVSQ